MSRGRLHHWKGFLFLWLEETGAALEREGCIGRGGGNGDWCSMVCELLALPSLL